MEIKKTTTITLNEADIRSSIRESLKEEYPTLDARNIEFNIELHKDKKIKSMEATIKIN